MDCKTRASPPAAPRQPCSPSGSAHSRRKRSSDRNTPRNRTRRGRTPGFFSARRSLAELPPLIPFPALQPVPRPLLRVLQTLSLTGLLVRDPLPRLLPLALPVFPLLCQGLLLRRAERDRTPQRPTCKQQPDKSDNVRCVVLCCDSFLFCVHLFSCCFRSCKQQKGACMNPTRSKSI